MSKSLSGFKELGLLVLEGGWNGGQWLVRTSPDTEVNVHKLISPSDTIMLGLKSGMFDAKIISITGIDHDHGHEYKWTNKDFILSVPSEIGIIEVSLRKYKTEGRNKAVKVKIYVKEKTE